MKKGLGTSSFSLIKPMVGIAAIFRENKRRNLSSLYFSIAYEIGVKYAPRGHPLLARIRKEMENPELFVSSPDFFFQS